MKKEIITDLNGILERVASVSPMTDKEYDALAFVINKKAHEERTAMFEKMASDMSEPTRKEMELIEKKVQFKFQDASSMENGEFIVFPEMSNGQISMTPGVVLSELDESVCGIAGRSFKFVCAIDGRIKVIGNGEQFLCTKAPNKAFKLPTNGLGVLKQGDVFFAIKDNDVIPPSEVTQVINVRVGDRAIENAINSVCKVFDCCTIDMAENQKDVFFATRKEDRHSWKKGRFAITSMDGKKFEKMPYHEFLEAKAKETVLAEDMINAVMPKWTLNLETAKDILTTDMQTPIIKVKGIINTNFKSQHEFDTKNQLCEAGYDVEKVAFTMNTVTVYCNDRKQGIYNMVVEYRNTEERFMNLRKQIFNRVSQGKAKAILRILKFEGNMVSEIIFKAKNEPKAVYPIPASCTQEDIKELQGGEETNVSKENIKNSVKKYVNPLTIAKGLAVATTAGLAQSAATDFVTKYPMSPANLSKLDSLNSIFKMSGELSGELEKAAQKYESEDFLDYARVMAISAKFGEKIATIIEDKNNAYPSIKEVSQEIMMAKPVLEKFAYDLTTLKVNQSVQGHELIAPNVISETISTMDNLYKCACAVNRSINKDDLTFK